MNSHLENLHAPWTLAFDQDGTEDYGTILDGAGNVLVTSRTCWLPGSGDDKPPAIVAQLQLMTAAPKLLEALDSLLGETVDMDMKCGCELTEGEEEARQKALTAIAETTETAGDHLQRNRGRTVRMGNQTEGIKCPTNVGNLPPDPEGMNDRRAAWAGAAIATFQLATGTDFEESLGDLLANLMHWADRHAFDFEAAMARAQYHYEAETNGGDHA